MNAVNRPIAVATAHKLRSAAAAILADAAKQVDARLADSLMYEAGEIKARADSIEEQVKPAIEEPTDFGSVVRAQWGGRDILWVRWAPHGWLSEAGASTAWSELTKNRVEVLRVGIGDVISDADRDAFSAGFSAATSVMYGKLRTLRCEAITSERQSAYDRAIEAVEEMQP